MPPENLEARVSALETQVRDLAGQVRATKQDAAAARVLAGAADRDVTEIRGELRDFRQATTLSFNALRQDMLDLRQDMNDGFRRVDEKFARVDDKFALVDNGFAEMRAKFDVTAAGQQRIVELIQTVIDAQGDKGST
ncbi:hypothetical protein ACAG26_02840 [Mycobacterium sp. pUA109]|uniref:hypothetical protein n=1 Tax=Mycobacterium sp. pUA109 TaxID=3238982 RepID=UPI00351B4B59